MHIVMELLAELLAVHGYSCSRWLQLNGAREGRGGETGAEFQLNMKSATPCPTNIMQTHTDKFKLNYTENVFPNVHTFNRFMI